MFLRCKGVIPFVFLVFIVVVSTCIGSVYIPIWQVIKIVGFHLNVGGITPSWPTAWDTIIWDIRFPRVLLAGIVGSALAVSGATYQGLFRNPLADPYFLGVAGGAALGAAIVLLTAIGQQSGTIFFLPVAAFVGAITAVAITYFVAQKNGDLPLFSMILAGVAVSSLAGAATSYLMISSDPDIRPLIGWLLGGFIGVGWTEIYVATPYILPGIVVMVAYGRILNTFQIDREEAAQLGVNVERSKLILVTVASLTVAAAVSVSGVIGFVGIIAPHAVRLIWGNDYRSVVPIGALVGAGLLIISDLVARVISSPGELPVGVVTAFFGAPFFLYLMKSKDRMHI